MNRVALVRPFLPHEWRIYRDLRLRALADSLDAFSRMLAEERAVQTEWSSRLASGADAHCNIPLVAELGAEPIGLAWGRIDPSKPDVAHLHRMWVDPGFRRLGAAQMLLDTIIAWATAANVVTRI